MARLIGETPPGPLPPLPPSFSKHTRDIILCLVAFSCIGETVAPQIEPRAVHKGT